MLHKKDSVVINRLKLVDIEHIGFAHPIKQGCWELVVDGLDIHCSNPFLVFGVHYYIIFEPFYKLDESDG